MTVEVKCSKGFVALISDEDADLILPMRWNTKTFGTSDRARAYAWTRSIKPHLTAMHRLIMSFPKGFEVDHINGNGLDNRRETLRLATRSQNCVNQHASRSECGFRGVTFNKGRCVGKITVACKEIYTNRFFTAEEAARARDALALEYFGSFARLNFSQHDGYSQSLEGHSARSVTPIPGPGMPIPDLTTTVPIYTSLSSMSPFSPIKLGEL